MRADPHQLLRSVKLPSQDGQHIHAGQRLALKQHSDVVAVHFDADGFFHGGRVGLVRCLFQHGSKPKELAGVGFVDHHFLVILIDGSYPHRPDTIT